MTITTKFDIADRVCIKELDCEGVVLSVWFVSRGLEYEVRYFHNGEAKNVYFFEEELEHGKPRTSN